MKLKQSTIMKMNKISIGLKSIEQIHKTVKAQKGKTYIRTRSWQIPSNISSCRDLAFFHHWCISSPGCHLQKHFQKQTVTLQRD